MEEQVKDIVEYLYRNEYNFIKSYREDPKKVFSNVSNNMKITPINLKAILKEFYEGLTANKLNDIIA